MELQTQIGIISSTLVLLAIVIGCIKYATSKRTTTEDKSKSKKAK